MAVIIALVSFLLLFAGSTANAGVASINAQYGAPVGYSEQSSCQTQPYTQCLQYSNKVLGWYGTVTVKAKGVELLSWVVCGNNQIIWRGEQFLGTVIVSSPAQIPDDLTGPCWVEYQEISTYLRPPGGAWEIQLSIYFDGDLIPLQPKSN